MSVGSSPSILWPAHQSSVYAQVRRLWEAPAAVDVTCAIQPKRSEPQFADTTFAKVGRRPSRRRISRMTSPGSSPPGRGRRALTRSQRAGPLKQRPERRSVDLRNEGLLVQRRGGGGHGGGTRPAPV